MSDTSLRDRSSAAEQTTPAPKRRKIRKGTQSCWECKRRKIRCTFAAPADTVCDGCRSRQTRCISQDVHDEAAMTSRKGDRLSRVESLVEKLVEQSNTNHPDRLQEYSPDEGGGIRQEKQSPRSGQHPTSSNLQPSARTTRPDPNPDHQLMNNVNDISSVLLAAWPSQHDLNLLLSVPVASSVLLHGVVCQAYSEITSSQTIPLQDTLQLPSLGSHPVLIARKILLLATFLQGFPPCSAERLIGLSSDYRTMMSHVFNTATRFVTSNDELISSIEGIECVMMESMYLNNAGNLRRAWLVNRRAILLAQMMGLHTGTISAPRAFLKEETRNRINPSYMWFRIVCSDRYLSLMLGLPQASVEDIFATPAALENCAPVERLERVETVAAGLIIQRNSAERTDLAATHNVDKMLREAAALMPPQWWIMTPSLTDTDGNDHEALEATTRLTSQFAYHHLLVQLHLPYMMLPSSHDPRYDYSKMTAANASRSIVTQFVMFRESVASTAYCRGIDFITFIASTTLCLAHIQARRQSESDVERSTSAFQSLQHQRLSDRGWLERTLEIMETTAQSSCDAVAQKIADILRPLLAVESNSLRGDYYHVCALSEANKEESQCLGKTSEAFHELRIQIPYCGTIRIEHRTISPGTTKTPQTVPPELYQNTSSQEASSDLTTHCDMVSPFGHNNKRENNNFFIPGLTEENDDWILQGVDMALFNNLAYSLDDLASPT